MEQNKSLPLKSEFRDSAHYIMAVCEEKWVVSSISIVHFAKIAPIVVSVDLWGRGGGT